jgi:hypothetical protein
MCVLVWVGTVNEQMQKMTANPCYSVVMSYMGYVSYELIAEDDRFGSRSRSKSA